METETVVVDSTCILETQQPFVSGEGEAKREILEIPNEPTIRLTVSDIVNNKSWQTLELDNVISLRTAASLSSIEYTEICTAWIEYHRPGQSNVEMIWLTIPLQDLSDRYIWDLKNHLGDSLKYQVHAKSSGNQDTIGDYSFPCNTVELKNKKKTWVEWHGCKIQPCMHLNLVEERKTKLYGQTLWQTRVNPRRNHALTLELNSTVPLYKSDKEIDYSSCDEQHNAHYHPGAVIHWWGWTDTWRHRRLPGNTDSLEFDSLDDESCRRTFVSMITNTLDEFIEKINRGGTKYIACMVARQPSKSKKCGCQF